MVAFAGNGNQFKERRDKPEVRRFAMKRRSFLRDGVLVTTGLAISPWSLAGSRGGARARKSQPSPQERELPVVTLTGSPLERGRIHGETLKPKINELIKIWKDELHKAYNLDPDKYIGEFVDNTRFTEAIKKWTPHLMEEVRGISQGSGIDIKTVFAFQLPDEEWWYGRNRKLGISIGASENCSALGVYNQTDLPPLLAQNLDLPAYFDGFQTLLHVKHQNSSLESYILTTSGFIAACGLNNKSVGICCNTLLQLNQRTDGLPVAFIVRGVLEQSQFDEATKFVHEITHASGQNYTIGGPEQISVFECSANKVSRFIPYEGATRVYHTNHPLVNDDQSIYQDILKDVRAKDRPKSPGNSEIRFASLEKRLKDPSQKITVETIKSILGSRDDPENPVCRPKPEGGGGACTFGCIIMELSASPQLSLAPGPPCSTQFKVYKF
jgi:isopenicillin-N N-acyltransferase-like protein